MSTLRDIHLSAASSKSSDKLAIMMAGLEAIPQEKLDKLKTIEVNWTEMGDYDEQLVLPVLKLEFFQ